MNVSDIIFVNDVYNNIVQLQGGFALISMILSIQNIKSPIFILKIIVT